MAILQPSEKTKRSQIRVNIDDNLLKQMQAYCDWVGITKVDEFIEQAARHVFKKDKEWAQHQKNKIS